MLDGRRQGGEKRGGRRAPEPVRSQEDGVFPGRRAPLGPRVEPGALRERAGERPLVLGAKGGGETREEDFLDLVMVEAEPAPGAADETQAALEGREALED